MADVFISYSRVDRLVATELAALLEAACLDVWWDADLVVGDDYTDVIDERLEKANRVVVLWSRSSVGSRWVKAEARVALEAGKVLPVLLEEVAVPLDFRGLQMASLVPGPGESRSTALARVAAEIIGLVAPGAPTPRPPTPGPGRSRGLGRVVLAAAGVGLAMALLWSLREPGPDGVGGSTTPPDPAAVPETDVEPAAAAPATWGPPSAELIAALPGRFVRIEPATFEMGFPAGASTADSIAYDVTISRPFELQDTEVTFGQWWALMGSPPSHALPDGDLSLPVERVSWFEALVYSNRLSESQGLPACYRLERCSGPLGAGCATYQCPGYRCYEVEFAGLDCRGYRLPTQAEWELAARPAGATAEVAARTWTTEELQRVAWYTSNSGGRTHPVASREADPRGLFDMKGNVAEWVSDPEYDHRKAAAVDPIGDHSVDGSRGTRGGGWGHNSVGLVVPLRVATQPGERRSHIGFRVARTPRDSGRGDPR